MLVRFHFAFVWLMTAVCYTGCAAPTWKIGSLDKLFAKAAAPEADTKTVAEGALIKDRPAAPSSPAQYLSPDQQAPVRTPLAVPAASPPATPSVPAAETAAPETARATPNTTNSTAAVVESNTTPPTAVEPPTIADLQQGKAINQNLKPLSADRIAARAKDTPPANTPPPPAATADAELAPNGFTATQLATLQKMLMQVQSGKSISPTDILLATANQSIANPGILNAEKISAAAATLPPVVSARDAAPLSSARESTENETSEDEDPVTRVEELRRDLTTALEHAIRLRRGQLSPESRIRYEQELRLSYLAANRVDDATQKIEALSGPAAESYRHLLFALSQITPQEEDKKPAHRHARVLKSLRDAAQELSAASRLELRNMTFCEAVEQFGWYTEFKRREFVPGQQLLLYVEVENVTSERKGPQQFETELQGSYQIFDTAGKLVAERTLPLDKENCRNWRRDYFLAYRIYLPDSISAGNYRLELQIEDIKGKSTNGQKKLGEGIIEFAIR